MTSLDHNIFSSVKIGYIFLFCAKSEKNMIPILSTLTKTRRSFPILECMYLVEFSSHTFLYFFLSIKRKCEICQKVFPIFDTNDVKVKENKAIKWNIYLHYFQCLLNGNIEKLRKMLRDMKIAIISFLILYNQKLYIDLISSY